MRVDVGIPVVRTDSRAYGHVIIKFSPMGRLPHFITYRAPRAGGAPLKILKPTIFACDHGDRFAGVSVSFRSRSRHDNAVVCVFL